MPVAICLTYANIVYEPTTPISSALIAVANWLAPTNAYMRTTHTDIGVYISMSLVLVAMTKRNVIPTMTQMNLKYAISAKNRARTVAGVSILSTMTNRQYHQKMLKSMAATRGATCVIGTTKFYGGWDFMLKTLYKDVDNPHLMGWDYPKCDRAMPNMCRIFASLILARREEAVRQVRSWIGFDVEGAHASRNACGTNVPLQLGFSTGVNFVVQPVGVVDTP